MDDYQDTYRFRALLDAAGIFWTDVTRPDRKRTVFRLNEDLGGYWYADDRGPVHGMTVHTARGMPPVKVRGALPRNLDNVSTLH